MNIRMAALKEIMNQRRCEGPEVNLNDSELITLLEYLDNTENEIQYYQRNEN